MKSIDHNEIAALLDAQYDDYRAMLDIGTRQRNCLSRSELPGLDDSFKQMHACMDRIRMRDSRLPQHWQETADPLIEERRSSLRQIIGELDRVRLHNEQSVRDLLRETRLDLKRSQRGHRAVKNYLSHNGRRQDARFYDGTE
jgi:hypothetical protein